MCVCTSLNDIKIKSISTSMPKNCTRNRARRSNRDAPSCVALARWQERSRQARELACIGLRIMPPVCESFRLIWRCRGAARRPFVLRLAPGTVPCSGASTTNMSAFVSGQAAGRTWGRLADSCSLPVARPAAFAEARARRCSWDSRAARKFSSDGMWYAGVAGPTFRHSYLRQGCTNGSREPAKHTPHATRQGPHDASWHIGLAKVAT